jgi:hypothetical protein
MDNLTSLTGPLPKSATPAIAIKIAMAMAMTIILPRRRI